MSIRSKLSLILSFIIIIVLVSVLFVISNAFRMNKHTNAINTALESVEVTSHTHLLMKRQINEFYDYVISLENDEYEKYKRNSQNVILLINDWEKLTHDGIDLDIENNSRILKAIIDLKKDFEDLEYHISEAITFIDEEKNSSLTDIVKNRINPIIYNYFLDDIDNSFDLVLHSVQEAYDDLLTSPAIVPWIIDDAKEELLFIRNEFKKVILIDKIQRLIGRHLISIKSHLIINHSLENFQFQAQKFKIYSVFEDWIRLELILDKTGNLKKEDLIANLALNKFKNFEKIFEELIGKEDAHTNSYYFEIVEKNIEEVIEGNIYLQIDNKFQEYLSNINESHQKIKRFADLGFFVVFISIVLIAVGLVWVTVKIVKNLLFSVQRLIDGAKIISEGNLTERIEINSEDELNLVAKSFNNMAIALEESIKNLRNSEENLSAILSSIKESVLVVDLNNQIIFINQEAEKLVQLKSDMVRGTTIGELLIFKEKKRHKLFEPIFSENLIESWGCNFQMELIIERGEKKIPILLSVSLLKNNEGENKGFVFVIRDTTLLEDLNQKVIKQEKMASIGKLAAVVSHELRNPLGTIRSSAYFISKKISGKNLGVEKALDRLDRNTVRCDKIVAELHDYMREKSPDLAIIYFDQWLINLIDEFNEKGYKITYSLNFDKVVRIDKELINRIWINLAENAYQAFESSVENFEQIAEYINISTSEENGNLKFVFKDFGPGMSEENMDKIFEPLFSTKNFGLGIGLPIVKQIVEQHKGKIICESELGIGTTFTILIPID